MKEILLKNKLCFILSIIIIGFSSGITIYAGYQLTLYSNILDSRNIEEGLFEAIKLFSWWLFVIVLTYFSSLYQAYMTKKINICIRNSILNKITSITVKEYDKNGYSLYSSWLINDISLIESNAIQSIYKMIEASFFIFFSLIALAYIHVYIAFLSLGTSLLLLLIPKIFNILLGKATYKISKLNEVFSKKVNSALAGFEIFIFHNCRRNIHYLIDDYSNNLEYGKFKFTKLQAALTMISSVFYRLFEFSTLVLTAILVALNMINIGSMFAVSNLSSKLLNGATDFIKYWTLYTGSIQLFKKYDLSKRVIDQKSINIKNKIELRNISLKFGEEFIFKNFNFVFYIGKKYAIVGKSGCGKSSILKLILKIYENTEGDILIDGKNINLYSPDSIYNKIAYIPQQPYIFDETIRFNLTLGNDYPEKEIFNSLKCVGLDDYVSKLPEGLDNVLHSDGKNLSGGQKQRIAIARGILEKKKIYFVDECTSSLDKENSKSIDNYFLSLPDITLVYVTHKLDDELKEKFDYILKLT